MKIREEFGKSMFRGRGIKLELRKKVKRDEFSNIIVILKVFFEKWINLSENKVYIFFSLKEELCINSWEFFWGFVLIYKFRDE